MTSVPPPNRFESRERLIYKSDHGEPVRLYSCDRGDYTEHRLSFGRSDGVVVYAESEGRVCFLLHERPSVNEVMLELPRGMRDSLEVHAATAVREFYEETLHTLNDPTVIGKFYVDTAIYPAKTTVVTGWCHPDEVRTVNKPEVGVLEVRWLDQREIAISVASGEIQDSQTLAALGMIANYRRVVKGQV